MADDVIEAHRAFIKLTGSIASATMLDRVLYWMPRADKKNKGFVYKTQQDWYAETGLTAALKRKPTVAL